jgi:hypothetical protein
VHAYKSHSKISYRSHKEKKKDVDHLKEEPRLRLPSGALLVAHRKQRGGEHNKIYAYRVELVSGLTHSVRTLWLTIHNCFADGTIKLAALKGQGAHLSPYQYEGISGH